MIRFSQLKRNFKKNVATNLLGGLLPLLVGIFAIPALIANVGLEKYSFLTISWIVIGYFSLFDFGISKAMTRAISFNYGEKKGSNAIQVIITGHVLLLALGLVVFSLSFLNAEVIINNFLIVSKESVKEFQDAFIVLTFSIPFVILNTGLRSTLEAFHKFVTINAIRIPSTALIILGPYLVSRYSVDMKYIMASLTITRILAFLAFGWAVFVVLKREGIKGSFSFKMSKHLLIFGGWLTVSSFVGPVLMYADRFVLSGMIGLSDVAFYTTPVEIITRLLFVPAAIMAVTFPLVSFAIGNKSGEGKKYVKKSFKFVLFLILPLAVVLLFFSENILELWLGKEFARSSSLIVEILAVGLLINSCGIVFQQYIQAMNRPDLTAKLHIFEVLIYFFYLFPLVSNFGGDGAAVSWLIRVSISFVGLFVLAKLCERKMEKSFVFTDQK